MFSFIKLGRELWENGEPGFYEKNTEKILIEKFTGEGFKIEKFGDFPGFSATIDGNYKSKPIILIADMDALPNPGSGSSKYIHSCGHHVQMTALAGAAALIKEKNPALLEKISFFAVPAEEYINIEKRETLRSEGKITHLSGKLELIERGVFDHSEYVISMHSAAFDTPLYVSSVLKMSGFRIMNFTFRGKSSHGGAAPHLGINAQNAASLFLQACAFLRESFNEDDHIRIHPIIRLPENQSVNLIPDHAFVETYVRGAGKDAVDQTVLKLQNAAQGCSKAIGADVEISITPGYEPFTADRFLHSLLKETSEEEDIPFIEEIYSSASSDVGNISQIKPTIMLGLPGSNGKFHNPDFRITDEEAAYVFPAQFLLKYLGKLAGRV